MRHGSRFAFGRLFLLLPLPALSQSTRFEVSAFVEPQGSKSDAEGTDFDAGIGIGVGWRFSPDWSAEARALLQDAEGADSETYQLGVRYAFGREEASVRSFVQAGLHYREDSYSYEIYCVQAPCPQREVVHHDDGLFVGGGIDWQLRSWFAFRFDGRVALYESWATGDFSHEIDLTLGSQNAF